MDAQRKGLHMLVWNRVAHIVEDDGDEAHDVACDCRDCEPLYTLDDDTGRFSMLDFERSNPDSDTSDILAARALQVGQTLTLGGGASATFVMRRVR
jgi:hypothetical protein